MIQTPHSYKWKKVQKEVILKHFILISKGMIVWINLK
jgi:hypothetical protein